MTNMNFAQPESSAESITRITGAIAAVVGVLTLWGLYSSDNPTNWLSNIGLSLTDNSFRSLSIFGAVAIIIGGCLFFRKGLYLIIVSGLVILALVGHNKWYTIGNSVNAHVIKPAAVGKPQTNQKYINTGAALTRQQKQWCDQDDNSNGILNRLESPIATQNCKTGYIHKAAQ